MEEINEVMYWYQYTINLMNDHTAHYNQYKEKYLKIHCKLRSKKQKKEYREARHEYYEFMFARRNELHKYEKRIKAL